MSMENYETVLADLEARRAQIDAAIQAIRLMMGAGTGAPVSNGSAPIQQRVTGPQDVPPGEFHRLSIVDATKKYLDMVKAKQPISQIIRALEQGGLPPAKYNTVYSVLRRREGQVGDLLRIGDEWALTEWYPNNPNLRKQTETKKPHRGRKRPKNKKGKITGEAGEVVPARSKGHSKQGDGKLTICDAAERVLLEAGTPMHAKMIADSIMKFSKYVSIATLARSLTQDSQKRFVRVQPNVFELIHRPPSA